MALKLLDVGDIPLQPPTLLEPWLTACRERIQTYWDQFNEKPLPQYIECDFDLVGAAMAICVEREILDGRLFVEWGAGFGVVTGMASLLGLDAIGIEAEEFLCDQARLLMAKNNVQAEMWQGNFLPAGARDLADDTDPLVSLTHYIPAAYEANGMSLEDFALIFAYPWPGEEHFLRLVFDRFARSGAIMLMFRGPNHIEIYRRS